MVIRSYLVSIAFISLSFSLSHDGDAATLAAVTCDPKTKKCTCPEDPLTERYPDPTDPSCQHYFLCHLGHAFPKKCEVRLAFHPDIGECISRKRIPERICDFAVRCEHNGFVEDPDDCTKYYMCFYGQPIHYGCDDGHVFDQGKQQCLHSREQADHCLMEAMQKREPEFQHLRGYSFST